LSGWRRVRSNKKTDRSRADCGSQGGDSLDHHHSIVQEGHFDQARSSPTAPRGRRAFEEDLSSSRRTGKEAGAMRERRCDACLDVLLNGQEATHRHQARAPQRSFCAYVEWGGTRRFWRSRLRTSEVPSLMSRVGLLARVVQSPKGMVSSSGHQRKNASIDPEAGAGQLRRNKEEPHSST